MSQSDRVTETRTPRGVLDRVRANPTGRLALKIGVGVLGGLVVALGIVLIPFPGPGWAIVILGLAIWAVEFVWARHLLQFTKRHVQSWTHWVLKQSLPVRALIGLVGFIFICAVVWVSVKLTMHIDLAVEIRDFIARR
ncbi:TIGR02611 family protein [Actinoplanes sp. NPDC049548]|uniref:TIGR02611 family protein n=1 Tax=Actinoplanes sp. NPDC049548 TaxID=3155152 RepID=UPI003444867B